MSYRLQVQNEPGQPWETLYTDKKPTNVVVEYLASLHEESGYPLYRIQDGGTTHLWTMEEGGRGSSRYLDKLVDQVLYVVLNAAKRIQEKEDFDIEMEACRILEDEYQVKWENGELGNSEDHVKVKQQ